MAHVSELARLAKGAKPSDDLRLRGASVISELSSGESWGSEQSYGDEDDDVNTLVANMSLDSVARWRMARSPTANRMSMDSVAERPATPPLLPQPPPRRSPRGVSPGVLPVEYGADGCRCGGRRACRTAMRRRAAAGDAADRLGFSTPLPLMSLALCRPWGACAVLCYGAGTAVGGARGEDTARRRFPGGTQAASIITGVPPLGSPGAGEKKRGAWVPRVRDSHRALPRPRAPRGPLRSHPSGTVLGGLAKLPVFWLGGAVTVRRASRLPIHEEEADSTSRDGRAPAGTAARDAAAAGPPLQQR